MKTLHVLSSAIAMLFFICSSAQVKQQPLTSNAPLTIRGLVKDNLGLPLPGAAVIIKGTKTGTSTDFDGKYSIVKAHTSLRLVHRRTTNRIRTQVKILLRVRTSRRYPPFRSIPIMHPTPISGA